MKPQIESLLKSLIEKRSLASQEEINDSSHSLFGPGALLDSLEFVDFIIETENEIFRIFNKKLNLRKSILDNGLDVIRNSNSFIQFLEKELHK